MMRGGLVVVLAVLSVLLVVAAWREDPGVPVPRTAVAVELTRVAYRYVTEVPTPEPTLASWAMTATARPTATRGPYVTRTPTPRPTSARGVARDTRAVEGGDDGLLGVRVGR